MKSMVQRLSPELFWDVDISQLDQHQHQRFIIGRVFRWGDWADWYTIKRYYGSAVARRVLQATRNLDAKSREFWRVILS